MPLVRLDWAALSFLFLVDLRDGRILTTTEWSMDFSEVPLSIVTQWFFLQPLVLVVGWFANKC